MHKFCVPFEHAVVTYLSLLGVMTPEVLTAGGETDRIFGDYDPLQRVGVSVLLTSAPPIPPRPRGA